MVKVARRPLNVNVQGTDGVNLILFFNEFAPGCRVAVTREDVLPRSNVNEQDAHARDPEIDTPVVISVLGFRSTISCFWKLEKNPPIVVLHTKQVCEENKMSDPNAAAPRGLLNWWQGLILAASSALFGVIVAIFIKSGSSVPGAAPSWMMLILRFVPHFLLMFGVLADAFTYEGVYWTGTAVGLAAIPGAYALSMVFTQLARIPGLLMKGGRMRGGAELGGLYPGCSLTGLDATKGVPETLVITASILSYYIFDLMFNLSVLDAAGAIVAAIFLFGGQAMAISDCMDSVGTQTALAGLSGAFIGGASYGIISTSVPAFLPSSVIVGSIKGGGVATGGAGPGRGGVGLSAGDPMQAPLAPAGGPASASTCARA